MESNIFDLESQRLGIWKNLGQVAIQCYKEPDEHHAYHLNNTLTELQEIERYWAYPGYEVLAQLHHYLATEQFASLVQLCKNTYSQLQTKNYRLQQFLPFKTNLSLLDKPIFQGSDDLNHSEVKNAANKAYFEVLIIHPNPLDYALTYRNSLSVFKTDKDEFVYDILFVDNYKDALTALLANPSIQACVYLWGYHANTSTSQHSTAYNQFINRYIDLEYIEKSPLVGLKNAITSLRPELDHYFISELPLADIDFYARSAFQRILYHIDPFQDLHHTILSGIRERFSTPFFDALRTYSRKPKGVFHALPISRGQSIKNSHWIGDMLDFYGKNIFLAETSSTQGGMDSLLDPKGAIKQAQSKAAKIFRSQETYFVTNGTSTSNKIVMQTNLVPGDIVLTAADCHKSIPYAIMLSGAYPLFLETYPLNELDLYGAVPLERIKAILLDMRNKGHLNKVKQITLTNSTFDGLIYNTERFMLDILAIKPDIIFHWDEAWYSHAYFNPLYERRTAMSVANHLQNTLRSEKYIQQHKEWTETYGKLLASKEKNDHETLCDMPLLPDPQKVAIRVYSTQSTHKTLTSFRQGSMIHIFDEQHNKDLFLEAYRMHTSTSPNYQIIASLDVGRRQAALEGYERVKHSIELAELLREKIASTPEIRSYFQVLKDSELIPEKYRNKNQSSCENSHLYNYNQLTGDWGNSDFVVDPTRVTVDISKTGMDGTVFRELLINKYDIQVNKTSRNTVLFIVNIGSTEKIVRYLLQVLSEISNKLPQRQSAEPKAVAEQTINLPLHRQYHPRFIPMSGDTYATVDMRRAYYSSTDPQNIEYVTLDHEILKEVINDKKLVSASFVTPYPPGFPVLVPGQIITHDILLYLHKMRIKEIHGYRPEMGLKIFTDAYLTS